MPPKTFGTFFTTDPKAIEDLTLLPNLRTISELENTKLGKALLKALAARDITLIDEETATFRQKS
jgi:hypothetical protein